MKEMFFFRWLPSYKINYNYIDFLRRIQLARVRVRHHCPYRVVKMFHREGYVRSNILLPPRRGLD